MYQSTGKMVKAIQADPPLPLVFFLGIFKSIRIDRSPT